MEYDVTQNSTFLLGGDGEVLVKARAEVQSRAAAGWRLVNGAATTNRAGYPSVWMFWERETPAAPAVPAKVEVEVGPAPVEPARTADLPRHNPQERRSSLTPEQQAAFAKGRDAARASWPTDD